MNKVRSSKRRCIFTKFYEAVPIHIALNSNTVNHLVYSYINPLFSTTWSQMLFPLMQFYYVALNVIPLYRLAKITFVCFPSAVSHCKPLFNLLLTTSPQSFFFLVLSKHYLPSIVYLCLRLFLLSI